MQDNQWEIVDNRLLTKSPIELKDNSIVSCSADDFKRIVQQQILLYTTLACHHGLVAMEG